MYVDPKALVSAVGLLLAAIQGGQPTGYGVELVLVYDGESVEVGLDPRVYVRVDDLPLGLSGITMSNIVMVRSLAPDVFPDWALPYVRRAQARVFDYEEGHFYGWQRYGIMYALRTVQRPDVYDPCSPLYVGGRVDICERRAWEDATLVPPRHSLLRFRVVLP